MERKITEQLKGWKEKKNRMPLILNGARQVGKTYILKQFGKACYDHVVYVNLENNGKIRAIFEEDMEPRRTIEYLEALTSIKIVPGLTLIILDEIQASERALAALKVFHEEAPEYHITAAGSLLGVALHREKFSFPVGNVDEMTLYPLDFEEFLWAMGKQLLADTIRQHYGSNEPMAKPLHEEALEWYRKYLVIGGMPAAINIYNEENSLLAVTEPQQNIINEYIADMAKYAIPATTVKIRACFNSIPAQLAKENKKFQYKVVQRGGSATIFGESIDWLLFAGITLKCQKVEHGFLPVAVYADLSDFKLYMGDVGLLTLKSEMPSNLLLSSLNEDNTFMGGLVESYVAQALTANGHSLYYWRNDNRGELDFVLQLGDKVIPVEVKKGRHTKARSMDMFRKKYACPLAFRISTANFGLANGIKSIPLYAIFCIR